MIKFDFLKLFFNKPIPQTVISLGCNCFVRSVLARYQIIKRKEDGYMSLPFDLCITPLKSTIYFLQNDFKGLLDNIKWHSDLNCWYNPDFGSVFIHDTDCKTKSELIKRYKNRIKNFRKILNYAKKHNIKLTLVYHIDPMGPENNFNLVKTLPLEYFIDTNEDFNKLCKIMGQSNIVVIDTINSITKEKNCSNIHFIKLDIPSQEYALNWYKEEFFNSDEGQHFESAIANSIKMIINKG